MTILVPAPPLSARLLGEADLVQDAVQRLSPRWTTWALQLVLANEQMRYVDVATAMNWVNPGSLHTRLRVMEETGLLTRLGTGRFRASPDGRRTAGVYDAVGRWARAHLPTSGPVAAAERIEQSLSMLARSYTTQVLWTIGQGPTLRTDLLELLPEVPEGTLPGRLKTLTEDGLIARSGPVGQYRYELTEGGRALGASWEALLRWNRGEPAPRAAGTAVAAAVTRAQAAAQRSSVPELVFSHAEPPPPPYVQHTVFPSSRSR
jgi:DNA-binding HxlR family transcriptional regulator